VRQGFAKQIPKKGSSKATLQNPTIVGLCRIVFAVREGFDPPRRNSLNSTAV